MTSYHFDFDAVTHSIKEVSVSTRQSLASSELFRMWGTSRMNCCQNLKPNFAQVPEQSEFT